MHLCFSLFLVAISFSLVGQSPTLRLIICNEETKAPIEAAHIFYNQSTDGSFSNKDGLVELKQESISSQLIISHISYNLLHLPQAKHRQLHSEDTVFLTPLAINLETITIKENRTKKWKKRVKSFTKSLLGSDKIGKQAKIKNPEVLRFESLESGFKATAIQYLEIESKYLGYEIHFYLTSATVLEDGSSSYHGYANFIDTKIDSEKHQKRRAKIYNESQEKALYTITQRPTNNRYIVDNVQYENGSFFGKRPFDMKAHIKYDSIRNKYNIFFSDFLEIEDRHLEKTIDSDFKMTISGLESQRFNATNTGGGGKVVYPTSQLYKVAPFIIVDNYGSIVNKSVVKEYGFWATRKLASTLPTNYIRAQVAKHASKEQDNSLQHIRQLIFAKSTKDVDQAIDYLSSHWQSSFMIPLLDLMKMTTSQETRLSIKKLINQKEPQLKALNFYNGIKYVWDKGIKPPSYYPNFKAEIYKYVDPKFEQYFLNREAQSRIDFEKILWGGVRQDGIPPLRLPTMINAQDADYLEGDNVVFGIVIDGIARAYPKRIMGWHEFVVDTFGSKTLAGVYCTLCGTLVAYDTEFNGVKHDLGTSGFLYQSNKLMYDKGTQSLWNTIEGRPVVGPLIKEDIELDIYPVITTTWEKWLEQYPNSKVLSLDTGHQRNYNEGTAYKEYFSSNALMFPVQYESRILDNKQEVIVIRDKSIAPKGLAISTHFLNKKDIYQDQKTNLLVLSLDQQSYRIYSGISSQLSLSKHGELTDEKGLIWPIREDKIISPTGSEHLRVSTHRSFWFAYHNMYPDGRLIK